MIDERPFRWRQAMLGALLAVVAAAAVTVPLVLVPACAVSPEQIEAFRTFCLTEVDLAVAAGIMKPERADEFKKKFLLAEASFKSLNALLAMMKAETTPPPAPPPPPAPSPMGAAIEGATKGAPVK